MSQQYFEAIRAGDRAKLESLLATDPALLNARDANGLGAYAAARYSGRNEIAALLLEKGIGLSLFEACMAGEGDQVLGAILAEPDLVNAYSNDGWTPLHLACFFGQPELAEALIEKGADVSARGRNAMHNLPLHAAIAGRNRDAVRALLEHGADVNARQEGGWTALHGAAQNGDVETARLLIAAGANVAARADNQQNAMDLALTKGHQAMVDLLDEYATPEQRGAAPGAS